MKENNKLKKIFVITTGGTIGSILQPSSVMVDITGKRITSEIERAKKRLGYEVEVYSPINKNSEEFSPVEWRRLLLAIKLANSGDADGVVVTHGTDSMAYSVAASLAYSHHWTKKVCFTGSYYSPDHPSSDTSLSLLAALEFAASPHPANGVYVAFRSNRFNSEAKIIHGSDIKPMSFDEEYFESAYNERVATFSPNKGLSEEMSLSGIHCPNLGIRDIPSELEITKAQTEIAYIAIYPGIDKKLLRDISKNRKILIVQMYHSGTGPSGREYRDIIEYLGEHSPHITVLMGTLPKRFIPIPYDSTLALRSAGAHVYGDLQTHFLYVFSLLALSVGQNHSEIIEKLSPWEI